MKIGPYQLSNPWILAPMASVSEMPFRVLARELGASAAPTELVSSKGLLYGQERTRRYLTHDPVREDPFWVQIFGGEPESMAEGAERAVELGAKILDINMGCPVKKVTKSGAGSALMCDPQRAAAIVAAMVKRTGVPVTVKIRAGWDAHSLSYLDMVQAVADAGAAAIAMHARTRAQGYSGHANWILIRDLVQASPIPVIGNGDAFTPAAARRMKLETGCAAVMIGRGALGNPWIFAELAGKAEARPSAHARWSLVKRHLFEHLAFVGDELRGIRRFRSHILWYSHGLVGAAKFRREIGVVEQLSELLERAEAFFVGAQHDASAGDIEFDARGALG